MGLACRKVPVAKRCGLGFEILILTLISFPVFGMAVDWLGFGYAALVASGGVIGYAKAGTVWGRCLYLPLLPPLSSPSIFVWAGRLFTKASYLEVNADVKFISLCHVLLTCCCWGVVLLGLSCCFWLIRQQSAFW